MSTIAVGDRFLIQRRFGHHGSSVVHSRESTITKITAKRAYFDRQWFALSDPLREVKPKYLDYVETATPISRKDGT